MKVRVTLVLEIEGAESDASEVVDRVLDGGVLQDAINDHDCDAGPLKVLSAVVDECSAESGDPNTPADDESSAAQPSWPEALTPREVSVGCLLARGFDCDEIGVLLGLSPKTVHTHRDHVLDKTGLRDAAALSRFAVRAGLVSGAADADAPGCTERDTIGRRSFLAKLSARKSVALVGGRS